MATKTDTKKFLKRYKNYVHPGQRKRFIDWPTAKLEKNLHVPFDWILAQELVFPGNWHMIDAVIMILEGTEGGWAKARQSLYYHAWHMRILGGLQDQGKYKSYWSLDSDLRWLYHAIATYDDGFATWFGDRIVRSVQNKDDKFIRWDWYRCPPYVAKLYALWRGVPCEFGPDVKLDVYQQVFDRWDDDANFGEVVRALCDFHVKHASFEDGEFMHMPYDLAPFEILALLRVRRELGKPVPEVDHPLLQTPLAHPPQEPPEFHDEFLDKIIAKARRELPIGDPWCRRCPMPNRSYLSSSNLDTLYPSFAEKGYDASEQTIASDVEAVPLLWIAMFRPADMRTQTFEVQGQKVTAHAPICARAQAQRQLQEAIPCLNTLFQEEGALDGYAELLAQGLRQASCRFVTIEMQEIGWLWPSEDEFYQTFRAALDALAGPCPAVAREAFVQLAQLRTGKRFPSPRMYLDQIQYAPDDQWNFTRILGAGLFGAGLGREAPWESADADFGFEFVSFDGEDGPSV